MFNNYYQITYININLINCKSRTTIFNSLDCSFSAYVYSILIQLY